MIPAELLERFRLSSLERVGRIEAAWNRLVAVRDTGAYAFAMASNYNLRPRAAEVLVESGRLRLVRRRETFEDLVRTEVG